MAYETLLNSTYSPVCVKKTYTPSKAVKKILKMACKLLTTSSTTSKGHRELKNTPTHTQQPQILVLSEEELQNSQNEEWEAAAPAPLLQL
ncbi:uncharacterized protein LOC111066789 [Drosophila obscura]|uniref:uncharacterized protein LOC111066789 n=1 Tax=Drosophila obscura TaxID=7282 RepID=UPI000BA17DE7|nr:uncharacterized protein LOC111066789 [Drosophila obscura]